MSATESNDAKILGLDRKELALIVVLAAIVIVMSTYGIAIITAFLNTSNQITITGTIDLGQIQTIVLVITSGGLVLLGITTGAKINSNAVKETDQSWMNSEDMTILPPNTPGKTTGYQMPDLYAKTVLLNLYINKINDADIDLTPAEQAEAIKAYQGITAAEMEAIIPLSGPELATSIRAIINKHRATNRSDKDKNKIR